MLSSCNDMPFKVGNPQEKTTVEIIDIAKTDTTNYKLIERDGTFYALNNSNGLVEYKFHNYSGGLVTLSLILIVIFFIIALLELLRKI
jgi:hypothetical protein